MIDLQENPRYCLQEYIIYIMVAVLLFIIIVRKRKEFKKNK